VLGTRYWSARLTSLTFDSRPELGSWCFSATMLSADPPTPTDSSQHNRDGKTHDCENNKPDGTITSILRFLSSENMIALNFKRFAVGSFILNVMKLDSFDFFINVDHLRKFEVSRSFRPIVFVFHFYGSVLQLTDADRPSQNEPSGRREKGDLSDVLGGVPVFKFQFEQLSGMPLS